MLNFLTKQYLTYFATPPTMTIVYLHKIKIKDIDKIKTKQVLCNTVILSIKK